MVTVFCRECKQKVEDCAHFVYPIRAERVSVFDPKIETLAYDPNARALEIAFKNGQIWQLANVPAGIYSELSDSTITSFLKFIARRYKASPVKRGLAAVPVPQTLKCPICSANMTMAKKVGLGVDDRARVFWECPGCKHHQFNEYEAPNARHAGRERRASWH